MGTVDAEITVPAKKKKKKPNPELSKIPFLELGVGQNIVLFASSAVRNKFCLLRLSLGIVISFSTFWLSDSSNFFFSSFFSQILFKLKALCYAL